MTQKIFIIKNLFKKDKTKKLRDIIQIGSSTSALTTKCRLPILTFCMILSYTICYVLLVFYTTRFSTMFLVNKTHISAQTAQYINIYILKIRSFI